MPRWERKLNYLDWFPVKDFINLYPVESNIVSGIRLQKAFNRNYCFVERKTFRGSEPCFHDGVGSAQERCHGEKTKNLHIGHQKDTAMLMETSKLFIKNDS